MEMEAAAIISRADRNCNFMHDEEMFYDSAYTTPLSMNIGCCVLV